MLTFRRCTPGHVNHVSSLPIINVNFKTLERQMSTRAGRSPTFQDLGTLLYGPVVTRESNTACPQLCGSFGSPTRFCNIFWLLCLMAFLRPVFFLSVRHGPDPKPCFQHYCSTVTDPAFQLINWYTLKSVTGSGHVKYMNTPKASIIPEEWALHKSKSSSCILHGHSLSHYWECSKHCLC